MAGEQKKIQGPVKPFDPKGGVIYQRPHPPQPPGQLPPEQKEGSHGGPERRG